MAILSKLESAIIQRSLLTYRKAKLVTKPDVLMIRSKHSDEGFKIQSSHQFDIYGRNTLHNSSVQQYPATKQLKLPSNVEDIASAEKSRFSPQRNRDISGSLISSVSSSSTPPSETGKSVLKPDERVESYDCKNAVNLSSAMQTNVPDPFKSKGKSTHLNMPGGQWGQGEKYMSDDLNSSHPINNRNVKSVGIPSLKQNSSKTTSFNLTDRNYEVTKLWSGYVMIQPQKFYSTDSSEATSKVDDSSKPTEKTELTRKEKLKAAIKDYGIVVVVFHVGISLISLGCCYLAVTRGVDFSQIIGKWGESEGAAAAGAAAPFVVAYAIHKAMAPGRITITLVSAPFIVRHLRKIGLIKAPKQK